MEIWALSWALIFDFNYISTKWGFTFSQYTLCHIDNSFYRHFKVLHFENHSTTSGTSWVNDKGGELSEICTQRLAVWVETSFELFLTKSFLKSSVWQLISCFLAGFGGGDEIILGGGAIVADPEQLLQIAFDLLLTKGTFSFTSMAPENEILKISYWYTVQ